MEVLQIQARRGDRHGIFTIIGEQTAKVIRFDLCIRLFASYFVRTILLSALKPLLLLFIDILLAVISSVERTHNTTLLNVMPRERLPDTVKTSSQL